MVSLICQSADEGAPATVKPRREYQAAIARISLLLDRAVGMNWATIGRRLTFA
jgi:hypothetical protein